MMACSENSNSFDKWANVFIWYIYLECVKSFF